jgi:starch-binding outer membrane protein, SusD/RagB family
MLKSFKINKMNTKYIILFIFSSLLLVSCNEDDFLDKKPLTPTDFAFYTSPDGAIQGINAAYDILQLGEQVGRVELNGTVCSGDAMAGGEPGGGDQPALQSMMKFSVISSTHYLSAYWNALYRGIYRCNLILYYIADPIEGFDENLRKRLIGEATYLRGLFHFKLQTFYGGMPQLQADFGGKLKGIPFVDRVLLKDEWMQERPEMSYTWERIEQDFAKAAELLPAQYDASNKGRATKGAATSMLAKTYLYQEKWDQAYQAAKKVIESGEYWLIGEDGHNEPLRVTRLGKNGEFETVMPGYKWIWQPEANNSRESIFDVQHFQQGVGTFPEGMEGNLLPRYYGPRAVKAYYFNTKTGTYDQIDTEYFWGFILPTKYFIETAFEEAGGVENGKIVDPRFAISVITPDSKIPYHYTDQTLREMFPDSAPYSAYFNNPATGYATWKYFNDPYFNNSRQTLGDNPQNMKYFRFADLLLIGAEAAIHTGNANDALTWVNRVRNRARNSGNTGFPKNLTSVTLENIYAERRVELAFESHQFFDLVRTRRAAKVLTQDAMRYAITTNQVVSADGVVVTNTVQEQYGDNFVTGRNEVWPIPQSEIDNTNGSITQNPGY